jgi:hypothetical protein
MEPEFDNDKLFDGTFFRGVRLERSGAFAEEPLVVFTGKSMVSRNRKALSKTPVK